jgi:hypothetical protein
MRFVFATNNDGDAGRSHVLLELDVLIDGQERRELRSQHRLQQVDRDSCPYEDRRATQDLEAAECEPDCDDRC